MSTPIATSRKVLEGHPNRQALRNHPKASGKPTMPAGLPKYAKSFWKKYTPILSEMGLISKIDEPSLIELAQTWNDLQEATQAYRAATKGTMEATRTFNIMAKSKGLFVKQGKAFGLSPLDRNPLSVTEAPDDFF